MWLFDVSYFVHYYWVDLIYVFNLKPFVFYCLIYCHSLLWVLFKKPVDPSPRRWRYFLCPYLARVAIVTSHDVILYLLECVSEKRCSS